MDGISKYEYNRPIVVSIAGFDPTGGAGLLSDIKTFEQIGCLGFGVQTAWTMQNEAKCFSVNWFSSEDIISQLEPLLQSYSINVAKIGMIQNFESIVHIIELLKKYNSKIQIVWDPVLSSSSAFDFITDINYEMLKRILKNIVLITPNLPELLKLSNQSTEEKALDFFKRFRNVLLKGGHRKSSLGEDVLLENGNEHFFSPKAKQVYPKHGSGCILSSAIAAYLAQDNTLLTAIDLGKSYIEERLASNQNLLSYHA